MNKYALFTAIGLLVGLGLGLAIGNGLWGDAPGQVARAAEIDEGTPAPAAGNDPLKHERDAKPDSRPDPVLPDEPTRDSRARTTLAEVIAKADIPRVPNGDGKVTGTVRAKTGEPLAGVTVSATPDFQGDRGWDGKTVEDRIAARIRSERWTELAKREALTAADGSYSVGGLDPAEGYYIGAKADGWRFEQEERLRHNSRHKAGDVCNLVGEVSILIEILVFMPDGSAAKSGLVSYGPPGARHDGGGTSIITGKAKVYLQPGKWEFKATGGEKDEMRSEAVELTVEAGMKPEPVRLQLKPVPGVIGTIKADAAGDALSQTRVYLQTNPPAEAPEPTFKNERNMASAWSYTGSFTFLELAPGNYRVLLVMDQKVCDWKDVVVTDTTVEVTLALPAPKREEYIIVRVYAPDGKLVSDVNFSLMRRSNNGSSSGGAREILQPDGSYWLFKRESTDRDGEEGWWVITATSQQWGSKDIRYELTDTHDLEIRFIEPANVTLTVDNFNEHPLRDKLRWNLQAAAANDDGRSWRPSYGRESAAYASPFKLGPVEPGEYFLVLNYSSDNFGGRELLRQRVSVTAGENALTASVPVTYTLTITADNERDLRRIEITMKDSTQRMNSYREEVKDGKLTMDCIAAGTYTLKSQTGEMEVTVNADTVIKFEPRAYDCLVLTLKDRPDVEGLGFVSGDRLIEIDGTKVGDMNITWAQIQTSMAKESTTWKVLRNGSPTEVTFDGRELQKLMEKQGDNGFKFVPGYQTG